MLIIMLYTWDTDEKSTEGRLNSNFVKMKKYFLISRDLWLNGPVNTSAIASNPFK